MKPAEKTSELPAISVSAAQTRPPVQLSATATLRSAARLAVKTVSASASRALSRALSVLQVQEFKLIYDASALLCMGIAFYLAQLHDFSFIVFLLSITLAQVIGYVIYAIVIIKMIDRRMGGAHFN